MPTVEGPAGSSLASLIFDFVVSPKPGYALFEQTVLQIEIGQTFLQIAGVAAQVLHFVRGRSTRSVTSKPALASLDELRGSSVIQTLGNAFAAAQLGDGVIAAQAREDDADLVLGREVPTGLAADILPLRPARQVILHGRIWASSSLLRH